MNFNTNLDSALTEYLLNSILLKINEEGFIDPIEENIEEFGLRKDLDWYELELSMTNKLLNNIVKTVDGPVSRKMMRFFVELFNRLEIPITNVKIGNVEKGKGKSKIFLLISSINEIADNIYVALSKFKPHMRVDKIEQKKANQTSAKQLLP